MKYPRRKLPHFPSLVFRSASVSVFSASHSETLSTGVPRQEEDLGEKPPKASTSRSPQFLLLGAGFVLPWAHSTPLMGAAQKTYFLEERGYPRRGNPHLLEERRILWNIAAQYNAPGEEFAFLP